MESENKCVIFDAFFGPTPPATSHFADGIDAKSRPGVNELGRRRAPRFCGREFRYRIPCNWYLHHVLVQLSLP